MRRKNTISKEKWEEEFEKLSDGLCEKKNEDGSMEFSAENAHKYFDRISKFPDLESWEARRKEKGSN